MVSVRADRHRTGKIQAIHSVDPVSYHGHERQLSRVAVRSRVHLRPTGVHLLRNKVYSRRCADRVAASGIGQIIGLAHVPQFVSVHVHINLPTFKALFAHIPNTVGVPVAPLAAADFPFVVCHDQTVGTRSEAGCSGMYTRCLCPITNSVIFNAHIEHHRRRTHGYPHQWCHCQFRCVIGKKRNRQIVGQRPRNADRAGICSYAVNFGGRGRQGHN